MDGPTPLGTIESLWRYPVKSLCAERLESVRVDRDGLEGDRRRALFVAKPAHDRNAKPYRGKEHPLLHTLATPEDVRTLEAARELELEEAQDGPYFDALPVSLVLDCWLRELEVLAGMRLEPLRFRPNLFVRAASGFSGHEAALLGARLEIGEVSLRVESPIERCAVPSYDVETGEIASGVLRALVQQRRNEMGIYCSVLAPGIVQAGATIEVIR